MAYYIGVTVLVMIMGLWIKNNSIYAGNVNCDTKGGVCSARQSMLNKALAFGIFFVLTVLSGTRVAVGNDFWVYRDNFELIAQSRVVSSEFGFNLIVRVVQWFAGYDNYMPIFFVFSLITVYFFVKALYDESEWFAASLFLLLTNGFYFSSLNTVRYYLAFAIALYSIKFLWQERHLEFLLFILFAATIHKTVLLVIPVYYLAKADWKKWAIPAVGALACLLVILRNPIRKLLFIIYPFYEGSYLDDYEVSYVNILKAVAVLVFCLIFYKSAIKGKPINRFYFNLNIAALIVFACLWYIPETTRIGYYFSASNIFLIPSVIKSIENKKVRRFFAIVIALAYGGFFAFYLKSLYATDIRILPYLNWFFAQ